MYHTDRTRRAERTAQTISPTLFDRVAGRKRSVAPKVATADRGDAIAHAPPPGVEETANKWNWTPPANRVSLRIGPQRNGPRPQPVRIERRCWPELSAEQWGWLRWPMVDVNWSRAGLSAFATINTSWPSRTARCALACASWARFSRGLAAMAISSRGMAAVRASSLAFCPSTKRRSRGSLAAYPNFESVFRKRLIWLFKLCLVGHKL